jgi:hypothetical protein
MNREFASNRNAKYRMQSECTDREDHRSSGGIEPSMGTMHVMQRTEVQFRTINIVSTILACCNNVPSTVSFYTSLLSNSWPETLAEGTGREPRPRKSHVKKRRKNRTRPSQPQDSKDLHAFEPAEIRAHRRIAKARPPNRQITKSPNDQTATANHQVTKL